jgi:HD-GYP domain-containing protein (c-di-GMP phosphodiesterase class II)
MKMAAVIARYHHERYDGSGYAEGLAGQDIPLPARIVAVADVFDALTSERPYKAAFSILKAKRMIMDESGKHFDPVIVEAFVQCFDEIAAVHRRQLATSPGIPGKHPEITSSATAVS